MIQAVKSEQQWRMPLLLKAARTMPVTKELLACTGIGWLIADSKSWPVTCQLVVKEIEMKWRKAAALKSDGRSPFDGWSKVRLSKDLMTFHGEKPSHFMAKVESLANWLRNNDDELVSPAIYQEAAWRVVLQGVENYKGLDGMLPQDCCHFITDPVARECLARGCTTATAMGKSGRIATMIRSEETAKKEAEATWSATRSAKRVAEFISDATTTLAKEADDDLYLLNVPLPWDRATPQKVATALQEASKEKHVEVMEALEKRRKIIMCSSFKGSAKSVVSGINCWRKFATTVLMYPEDRTIPPICSRDVCWFVTIFGCAGTAKNYVSAIRKACTIACCKTQHWDDEILKQALRGISSECLRNFGGPARCKWLLTQYWIDNVLVFLLNSQKIQLAFAVGIAWEFLLRL